MRSLFKKIEPLLVWGVSDLYFILAVTVTIFFGVLSADLQKQLNLTSSELGFLGFGFFLSFGVIQLLMGGLIDSWGPRPTLVLSAIIASIGLFLLSTAHGFTQAFLAQIITGAGFSISYAGAIYLASMWFEQKYFSILSGITQMSSNVVSASLVFIMALMGFVRVDFRMLTITFSVISLLIALLLFLFVRKSPDFKENTTQKSEFWKDLYRLLHIPQFWLGTIYFSTNIGVFLAFSSLWNIPDSLAYGHDLKTASMLSATLRFGGGLGAVLSGLIVGFIGKGHLVARYCNSGALILGSFLVYGPVFSIFVVFLVFALLGFFLGGSAQGFPLIGKYTSKALKGTGFGIMAAMGYLLCAFLQYIIGFLLKEQVLSSSLSPIHLFKIALTPLVATLAIGWVCTLFLQNTKNKSY